MSQEALFNYSDWFNDDGAFEANEKKIEKFADFAIAQRKRVVAEAQKMKDAVVSADNKDTEAVKQYQKQLDELKKKYEQVNKALAQLTKLKTENAKTSKKAAQASGAELIEQERLRQVRQKEVKEAAAIAKIKNTEIGSIEQMRAKLALVTIAWSKLSEEERQNGERGKRLVESKRQLTEELKKVEKETGDNRRNVGNYSEAVREAVQELNKQNRELTEDIALLKKQQSALKKGSADWLQYEKRVKSAEEELEKVNTELGKGNKKGFGANLPDVGGGVQLPSGGGGGGINAIGQGIGKVVSKLGPVGIAVAAVVTGLTAAANEVHVINTEFDMLRGNVRNLTGETGDALDELVVSAKAVSVVFGQDVNEVITAQNVLMKEFGLTGDEAARKIELGFLSNANATGDMIEQIKEYSSQIRDAGGDADDLIAILDQSGTQGVFSDKGIDVVKEFGLRIREQTVATRASLENAFGKEFSDRILAGVQNGSMSSLEALQKISERMNDTTIDAAALQGVVTNVFGGPGEDAGLRYLQSLKNINTDLESLHDNTNEATKIQQANLAAQRELATVQNEISKAIGDTSQIGLVWTNIQVGMYKALLGVINWVNKAIAAFQSFGGAVEWTKDLLLAIVDPLGLFHDMTEETEELTIAQREQMYVAIQAQHAIKEFVNENKKELVGIKMKIQAIGDENVSREQQIKNIMDLKQQYPELLADMNEENLQSADLVGIKTELNKRFTEEMILRKKNMVLKAVEGEADRQRAIIAKLAEGEAKDQAIRNLNTFLEGADIRIAQTEEELKIFLGLKQREDEATEDQLKNVVSAETGKQLAYKRTFDLRKTLYGKSLEELEKERSLELLQIERNQLALGKSEVEIQRALTRQKIMIIQEELAILEDLGQQETEVYIKQQIEKYQLQRQLDEQNRQIQIERQYKQAEVDAEIRRNFLLQNETAITESNNHIQELQQQLEQENNARRKAQIQDQIDTEIAGQMKLFEERKRLMRENIDAEYVLKQENARRTIEDERLLNLELQRLEEEKNNALYELDREFSDSVKQLNEQTVKQQIDSWEEFEKRMEALFDKILDKIIEIAEKDKEAAEERVQKQSDAVSEQERRAEEGLTNTLAFEQKALADREAELIEAEKRLVRRQKIKALYASYQNYANQGDENALGKALTDMAILEAIEATFGGFSKGGYTGDGNKTDIAGVTHKKEFVVDAKTTDELGLKGSSMKEFKDKILNANQASVDLGFVGTNFFSDQNSMFTEAVPVDFGISKLSADIKKLTKVVENKPEHSFVIRKTIEGFTELLHEIREGKTVRTFTTRL